MYKHCPLIVAASGFAVLVIGVICTWYAFPMLVESSINEAIALKDGNAVYETWKKQPFPLKFKINFFNVTNTEDVQNGENPILKEAGPYIYDMFIERVDLEVNEAEDTIKYMLKKTFSFNQKESGCRTEDDIVTIVNAALVGTALQVEMMLPSALSMVYDAVPYLYPGVKDVFLRVRVRDILFDGVRLHCTASEVDFICGAMKGSLPRTVQVAENGKDYLFSMFSYINGTPIGPFVMQRGMKNNTRGELIMYNDEEELSVWGEGGCNMINGSDSGMYFPMKKPVDRLYSFTADVCRSMYVRYEKEVTEHGIKGYRYTSRPESVGINKENNCFCREVDEDEYKCPPAGLIDLTPCLQAPVMMSFPHFYLGDKELLKYVRGLNPQKELHECFVVLEPKTATPLNGKKRVQMNIELKKMEQFPLLANISEGIFPILWLEEGIDLPEKYVTLLQENFKKLDMLDVFKWILIILGIIIMLSSFVLVLYQEKLMCFANNGRVTFNVARPNLPNHNIDHTTDLHFNSTVMYPHLYPQMENKNVSDGLIKRPSMNHSQEAWHIKM